MYWMCQKLRCAGHKRILWDIQGRACVSVVVSGAMLGCVAAAPDVTRLCRSVEDSSTHPEEEGDFCSRMEREERLLQGN